DRESKHAVQPIEDLVAPLLVAVDDHFGVAPSLEDVAVRLQFLPELGEVVDLAIEHDPHRFFAVGHRLMAASEIDDRESSKAKAQWSIEMVALIVGAAVHEAVGHVDDRPAQNLGAVAEVELAANAAHRSVRFLG